MFYISPKRQDFCEHTNADYNALLHEVLKHPIDFQTIRPESLRDTLNRFHQVICDDVDNIENRTLFSHYIVGDSLDDLDPQTIKNIAACLRIKGYEKKAQQFIQVHREYLELGSQMAVALDVCSEDTIHRCMRKTNARRALQLKIDKGVREQYGPQHYERFMRGHPLPIDQHRHFLLQQRAQELTCYYFDARQYQQWQRCVFPLYYFYCHPRDIDQRFTRFTQQLNLYTRQEADPIAIGTWAYCEFIDIHPYQDGNGRIARALLHLILGYHDLPLIDLTSKEVIQRAQDVMTDNFMNKPNATRFENNVFIDTLRAALDAHHVTT